VVTKITEFISSTAFSQTLSKSKPKIYILTSKMNLHFEDIEKVLMFTNKSRIIVHALRHVNMFMTLTKRDEIDNSKSHILTNSVDPLLNDDMLQMISDDTTSYLLISHDVILSILPHNNSQQCN
jgi:hypothetical protein